jgi:hypothetical protein
MGYYSNFTLETNPQMVPDTELTNQLAEAFRNTQPDYFRNYSNFDLAVDFVAGKVSLYEVKWYDCSSDILQISLKFPDIAFAIHRVGENFDVEAIYVKDGTIEVASREPDTSRPSPEDSKFRELFN